MPSAARPLHEDTASSGARLPRGPHALTREQVAANQRERLMDALGDLVGEKGYASTTVADVIACAGVSRKAFYEHFANKQECFLATYDTIVTEGRHRVIGVYREARAPADRTELAIGALFARAIENPAALRLVLVEIGAIGPAGIARRERLMADYEQLLRESLGLAPGPGTVPNPVLRAIVGGLNNVLYTRVQSGRQAELLKLVPDLVRWATSYYPALPSVTALLSRPIDGQPPSAAMIGGRAPGTLSLGSPSSTRRGLAHHGHGVSRSFVVHSQRERILDAVANLTEERGYAALTVEGIAERAAVSLQAFYEHFAGKEDAFLVAYELGHAKGLSIVERAFDAEPDWRRGVRAGIAALFYFLASEPSFAHIALVDALTATRRTADRATRGVTAYAQMLVPGLDEAPERMRPPAVTIEAIAGGIFELCLTYALQGRTGELHELLPRATYFALAPFVGSEQAGHVAAEPHGG
jgi:AcrR family transcriptional regulator